MLYHLFITHHDTFREKTDSRCAGISVEVAVATIVESGDVNSE